MRSRAYNATCTALSKTALRFSRKRAFTLLLALAFSLAGASPGAATGTNDRSFTPRVILMKVTQIRSGDEIQSGDLKVRLSGIATPPSGTRIGNDAVMYLSSLILYRTVSCRLSGQAFRDLELGACHLGGRDIAELLVREGLALPCARLGGRLYETDVRRAKDAGIGESFTLPRYCGQGSSTNNNIQSN